MVEEEPYLLHKLNTTERRILPYSLLRSSDNNKVNNCESTLVDLVEMSSSFLACITFLFVQSLHLLLSFQEKFCIERAISSFFQFKHFYELFCSEGYLKTLIRKKTDSEH